MTVLINPIEITGDPAECVAALREICRRMRTQPGFVDLALHQSIDAPDRHYVMVARWDNPESQRRAAARLGTDGLFEPLRRESTTTPRLFELLDGFPE